MWSVLTRLLSWTTIIFMQLGQPDRAVASEPQTAEEFGKLPGTIVFRRREVPI
jgi:hypothetical protein